MVAQHEDMSSSTRPASRLSPSCCGGDDSLLKQTAQSRIFQAIAQRDRLIQRQSLVMAMATQVLSETSTEKVLAELVSATYRVVDCDRVFLFMVDNKHVVCAAAPQGRPVGWRTPLGQGFAGHVAKTGRPLNIPDAHQRLDLFDPSQDQADNYKTHSVLAIPIKNCGEVIGVLEATNKNGLQPEEQTAFDVVDEQMLLSLLQLTAQHLRVSEIIVQCQEASARHQKTLELVETVCRNLELGESVKALAQATRSMLRCQRTLVFLVDEQEDLVCVADAAAGGSALVGHRMKKTQAERVIPMVMSQARPMRFDDADASHEEDLSQLRRLFLREEEDGGDSSPSRPPRVRSAMCCPLAPDGDSTGVVVAINREFTALDGAGGESRDSFRRSVSGAKAPSEVGAFRHEDVEQVSVLLRLAGYCVKSSALYENSLRTTNRFRALTSLLSDAKDALNAADAGRFASLILAKAIVIFECDRCTFFTVDSLNSEFLGYFIAEGSGELQELRVPLMGIAGCVANTRQMLNIKDAWSDSRFSNQTDLRTGYRTRTLLCAPLAGSTGKVIAVLQCVNKKGCESFTPEDEKMLFMVSCLLADLLQSVVAKSSLESFMTSDEIDSDVKDMFMEWNGQSLAEPQRVREVKQSVGITREFELLQDNEHMRSLRRWDFDTGMMLEEPTKQNACMRAFFVYFGLLNAFGIDPSGLDSFVTALRGRYSKSAAYHNWEHAFTTLHATFLLLDSWALCCCLPMEDMLALLIAAVGHDVEHPGYTNTFLVNTRHHLALRYNDLSVLESHHASTTCTLISSDRRVLDTLPAETMKRVRLVIVTSILGTDMVKHQDIIAKMESSKTDLPQVRRECQRLKADDAMQLGTAILHCADLVHPALPWSIHRARSQLIATEFLQQFTEETELGLPTLPFMGKDPNSLQQLAPIQVGFIQFVAAPLWTALNFFGGEEKLEIVKENIDTNRSAWQQLAEGKAITNDQPFQNPHNSDMCDEEDDRRKS